MAGSPDGEKTGDKLFSWKEVKILAGKPGTDNKDTFERLRKTLGSSVPLKVFSKQTSSQTTSQEGGGGQSLEPPILHPETRRRGATPARRAASPAAAHARTAASPSLNSCSLSPSVKWHFNLTEGNVI